MSTEKNNQPTETRIDSIDALRGLAVMGILWINLPGHAFSFYALDDPTIAGGAGANISLWTFTEISLEGAMRGLFSFVFGVGAALRFEKGISTAPYLSRYFWLILLGTFHGIVLLMPGDILLAYGVVALFLLPLRDVGAKGLIAISIVSTISLAGLAALDAYEISILGEHPPLPIDRLGEASYGMIFNLYAPEYFYYVFSSDFIALFLDAYAMMTLGMATFRSGLFDQSRNASLKSIGVAFVLVVASVWIKIHTTKVDFITEFSGTLWPIAAMKELARPMLSLGYALFFVMAWRTGLLNWTSKSLIALGRMALTNYLMQTIIAIFLFYGFGLGLYDDLTRLQLIPIVVGIWISQIIFSQMWLSQFQLGPVEWVWRRLSLLTSP